MTALELPHWHSTFSANAEVATSTVHACGDLDLLTVDLLCGTIDVLTRSGHFEITLDVAELAHIDAAGVELLAALQHSLSTHAGGLSIINATGPVRAQLQDAQIATRPLPEDGPG